MPAGEELAEPAKVEDASESLAAGVGDAGEREEQGDAGGALDEITQVPLIAAALPEDLRRYLLSALPCEERTVLEQYGFEPCCDHPGLEHRYAEGYFHAVRGSAHRTEPSVHPRYPSEVKLQRQPAPVPLAAFCEAFREQNASSLQELVEVLGASSTLSSSFIRGAHFADVSVQLNWGSAVPPEHAAWHTDAAYSLLHLAIGLQGERTLLACRRVGTTSTAEADLEAAEDFESLPQAEGDVYLSAPCLFPHAVQYPEASWEGRIVSVQCRFLLKTEELAAVKAELCEEDPHLSRTVLRHLRRGHLQLPSLQQVKVVADRLLAEERQLENELLHPSPCFTRLYGECDLGGTALHSAAARGHSGVVRRLLDHRKFRIRNAKDDAGQTALHVAAHQGHTNIVQLLADDSRFLEVNSKTSSGHTGLHTVAIMGHSSVFELLLNHERFHAHDKKCAVGGTALHVLAEMGRCTMMLTLLEHSRFTEANAKNKEGNTALHIAAATGEVEALRMLLEHPAFTESEASNAAGGTALHVAAAAGRLDTARALLDHPGFRSVNELDTYGNSALHSAAGVGASEVLGLLLEHPRFTVRDGRNFCGGTALHVAARMCQLEAVAMLLEHPRFTLVNATNGDGNTALHLAAKRGHLEGIQALLKHRRFTDVNAQNVDGKTALNLAAVHGHPELCKAFMEQRELGDMERPDLGRSAQGGERGIPVTVCG